MDKEIREKLISHMVKKYDNVKENDVLFSFCPYRVCPVGAHIDHQKGNVTGFAINYGVTIAYVSSGNHFFEATSLNFDGTKGDNIFDIADKKNDWADYLRGTAKILYDHYEIDKGIYCVIDGSLPIGGISSSAAVIIAFMKALCTVNGLQISKEEVVKLVQEVENKYVGVNSGTLDQSCELYCKKDNLLYLDTSTGKYKLIPKNKDMKRIGDQAEDIAEIIGYLNGENMNSSVPVQEMAQAAIKMVTESVDAYVNKDVALAEKVLKEDDIIDEYFMESKKRLIKMVASNPENGEYALDLLMIAKYFERIGDHATNIAEWVIFSVTGVHEEA